MARPLKIAFLISGRGSNMDKLLDLCAARPDQLEAVLVAADRPAAGLARAAARNIATRILTPADFGGRRPGQEQALLEAIKAARADWVFLAGYMAILSAELLDQLAGRVINIHPSLLPHFKGLDTHQRALAAGHRQHGLSVHLVTAGMDEGPVILQAAVPVDDADTPDRLAARVLAAEHLCYPAVLAALADRHLSLDQGVVWHPAAQLPDPAAAGLLWLSKGPRAAEDHG